MITTPSPQSKPRKLSCEVSQGSVLRPILYSIYTGPLGNIISSHGIPYVCSADDVQLYMNFGNFKELCCKMLSTDGGIHG